MTRECNAERWECLFCSAIARIAIKSVVDIVAEGGGRRYVASVISSGRIGCAPVTAKYGEQPMRRRIVTRSAQKIEYAARLHLAWSPSTALYSACRTSKCGRSTMPFAREL